MVWLFRDGALLSGAAAAEVRDCKVLVWPARSGGQGGQGGQGGGEAAGGLGARQCCVWSARLPACVLAEEEEGKEDQEGPGSGPGLGPGSDPSPVVLVAPLPVAVDGAADAVEVVASAERLKVAAGALQVAAGCFPAVVPESKLLLPQPMKDEDDDNDDDNNMSDDSSDGSDGSGAAASGGGGSLKQLALRLVEESERACLDRGLAELALEPCAVSFDQACELAGLGTPEQRAVLCSTGYGLGQRGCFVVAAVHPRAGRGEAAALAYSFVPDVAALRGSCLLAPISNAPMPEVEQPPLAPVTVRMDHQIYSLGAQRLSGQANGAGKAPLETCKDIRLRHASGSTTVVVDPRWRKADVLAVLAGAGLPVPEVAAAQQQQEQGTADEEHDSMALRQRKIIGCFNTSTDMALQLCCAPDAVPS